MNTAAKVQTGHFATDANSEFYYQRWDGPSDAKAVVLLVHGLGEHCNRYQALADALTNEGIAVCGLDLPGHGKSWGRAAHINSFDDYLEAVMSFHKQVSDWFPGKPIFLLGHSMGGLISAQLLLKSQKKFAGCILSGSAIKAASQPGKIQLALVSLLSRFIPTAGALALDASGVSRDATVVQAYVDDPLVHHGKASARLVREMFTAMQTVQDGAAGIELPVLILHGEADVMTSSSGSELLYESVSSTDKHLEIYPGLFHEIFNEPEGPAIHAQVAAWIVQRV